MQGGAVSLAVVRSLFPVTKMNTDLISPREIIEEGGLL